MDSRSFDTQLFGLTIDALASSPLVVDGMIEWMHAIHQQASTASRFIIDILLAPRAFLKLLMLASLSGGLGKEERAAVAQSTIAIGMRIMEGGDHAQSDGAMWGAIRIKDGFAEIGRAHV